MYNSLYCPTTLYRITWKSIYFHGFFFTHSGRRSYLIIKALLLNTEPVGVEILPRLFSSGVPGRWNNVRWGGGFRPTFDANIPISVRFNGRKNIKLMFNLPMTQCLI